MLGDTKRFLGRMTRAAFFLERDLQGRNRPFSLDRTLFSVFPLLLLLPDRSAQFGESFPFPADQIGCLGAGQFGMSVFGLQVADLCLRFGQLTFGAFPRGRFSGERGFDALQTTGRRS